MTGRLPAPRECSQLLNLGSTLLFVGMAALLSACAEPTKKKPEGETKVASAAAEAPLVCASAPAEGSTPDAGALDAGVPSCSSSMAKVEGFCIDRYEAYLVARDGGEETPYPYFERPKEGVTYEARSGPGVSPQAYINRFEAEAACSNAGKRLCSRREWQRACRGSQGFIHPYGQRWEEGRCNTEKRHLITLRFGADPSRWSYAHFNDPSLSQEPGFLAKSGEHSGCVGEAGVYDLVGNVHEWVSDIADTAFKARIDSEGVARGFQYWSAGNGVFMGGFFSTHGELGPGCTFTTVAHEAGYHDYSTGFRCCADAR